MIILGGDLRGLAARRHLPSRCIPVRFASLRKAGYGTNYASISIVF